MPPSPNPVQVRVEQALAAIPAGTPLLAVVGLTASGKSDLGIALAHRWGGEVISADSRQVYRGLDIGTGKVKGEPRPERACQVQGPEAMTRLVPVESEGIDHWLLDVAHPRDIFTAAEFQMLALGIMADIVRRGRLPILVGGTGLYVHAVIDGLVMPAVPPDPALRASLEGLPVEALRARLLAADPEAGRLVDLQNPRRMVRALEVALGAGPLSVSRGRLPVPFRTLQVGPLVSREEVLSRIHVRLLQRLAEGMVGEVERLLTEGLTHQRLEDLGLEYRYLSRHLRGESTHAQMVDELERAIARFARRQMTWFRSHGPVTWVASCEEACRLASSWVSPG